MMDSRSTEQDCSTSFHSVLAPLSLNTAYNRQPNTPRNQQIPSKNKRRASSSSSSSTPLRTRSNPEAYSKSYSSSPLRGDRRCRSIGLQRLFLSERKMHPKESLEAHYVGISSQQRARRHTCAQQSCFGNSKQSW